MSTASTIDWAFLEVFLGQIFGAYGKLIVTAFSLLITAGTVVGFIVQHRRATMLERILGRNAADVRKDQKFLEKGKAALEQAAERLKVQEEEIKAREQRLRDVRTAFSGKEHELWCIHAARKPVDYDNRLRRQRRSPIIMVANLKGGVGKTTLTANLAAYFSACGKRVLLADVDYQGSLSNMLLTADGVQELPSGMTELLTPGAAPTGGVSRPFETVLGGSCIIPAKYELASLENRLMIEYLLQDDVDDTRYRLANALLSEQMASTFDIALIDAPPRLAAGAINAFCASTHLLVPTVYDILSAEAVGTFLNGVQVLKAKLNPTIDLLGIVGMLTATQGNLSAREETAKNRAKQQVLQAWSANHHFFDRHIPRRAAIAAAAGEDIAYFRDATVRSWFDVLGAEISERLGIAAVPPQSPQHSHISRAREGADSPRWTPQMQGAVGQ